MRWFPDHDAGDLVVGCCGPTLAALSRQSYTIIVRVYAFPSFNVVQGHGSLLNIVCPRRNQRYAPHEKGSSLLPLPERPLDIALGIPLGHVLALVVELLPWQRRWRP